MEHPTYPHTDRHVLVGDEVSIVRLRRMEPEAEDTSRTGVVVGVHEVTAYVQSTSGLRIERYVRDLRLSTDEAPLWALPIDFDEVPWDALRREVKARTGSAKGGKADLVYRAVALGLIEDTPRGTPEPS